MTIIIVFVKIYGGMLKLLYFNIKLACGGEKIVERAIN